MDKPSAAPPGQPAKEWWLWARVCLAVVFALYAMDSLRSGRDAVWPEVASICWVLSAVLSWLATGP